METDVDEISEILRHARVADDAGLDLVSLTDHPYFAQRIDAYATLGFLLGATKNISAATIMTNLVSRPAHLLARTVTGSRRSLAIVSFSESARGVCGRNSSLSEFHASRPENEYGRSKRRSLS